MIPPQDNIFICDTDLSFIRTELHDFLSYWRARCGTRQYPRRADIKPGEILPLLPWTHLHDVTQGSKEFRMRLIGTILSDTFGNGDMRGKPISALPPGVSARVKQGIEGVLKAYAPVRTYAPHAALPGQRFQGIESCFAPLSGNGADIDMIIAVSILENRK